MKGYMNPFVLIETLKEIYKLKLSHFQMAILTLKNYFLPHNYNYIMSTTKTIQSALISFSKKD
jgi:hypothetical protein